MCVPSPSLPSSTITNVPFQTKDGSTTSHRKTTNGRGHNAGLGWKENWVDKDQKEKVKREMWGGEKNDHTKLYSDFCPVVFGLVCFGRPSFLMRHLVSCLCLVCVFVCVCCLSLVLSCPEYYCLVLSCEVMSYLVLSSLVLCCSYSCVVLTFMASLDWLMSQVKAPALPSAARILWLSFFSVSSSFDTYFISIFNS